MWLPSIAMALAVCAWILYEQAASRIAESERIKKKIPTRQVSMDEVIYSMEGRRSKLRIFMVLDLLVTIGLWIRHLWG
jgi:hypothetical protein